MAMLPIKKMRNPDGLSGKCYPVSVFECIYNTSSITVANDIGCYKKGDVIPAETKFSVIFHNMFEFETPSNIITSFEQGVSDTTVPSSKLTKEQIDAIFEIIGIDDNSGLRFRIKTNEEDIAELKETVEDHTTSIADLYDKLDEKANKDEVEARFDLLDSMDPENPGRVTTLEDELEKLKNSKQDKLKWLGDYEYEPNSNRAVTAANLVNLKEEILEKFSKVTNFRGVVYRKPDEDPIEAIERTYLEKGWEKNNGDLVIVDDDEYIYAEADEEWHKLGNTSNYIKVGNVKNSDISEIISQDKVSGLVTIQNQVTELTDTVTGLPAVKTQVGSHENRLDQIDIKFGSYSTTSETQDMINLGDANTLADSKAYTDDLVSNMNRTDSVETGKFVAAINQSNGKIYVTKNSLPVATTDVAGVIKPGSNMTVNADGTLDVKIGGGGTGGIGNVIGPSSSNSGTVVLFDGTTGKIIKDSQLILAKSVPSDAKFTDTTYTASEGILVEGTNIQHSNLIDSQSDTRFIKISYDSNGHITGKTAVTGNDIPQLEQSKITGLTDKITQIDNNVDSKVPKSWLDEDKDIASISMSGTWTYTNQDGSNPQTSSETNLIVENGFKASWTGNWKWYINGNQKDANRCDGLFGVELPPKNTQSSSYTTNIVSSNSSYNQTIYAPKEGLMVSGNKVVKATGEYSRSSTISVSFKHRYYIGYSTNNNPTEEDIKTLASTELTTVKTLTANNIQTQSDQYVIYAYPSILGDLSSIIMDGSTPVLGAFTAKRNITVMNSAGKEIDYIAYVSNNPGAFVNKSSLKFQ